MATVQWPSSVPVVRVRWGYDHAPYFSRAVTLNRRTGGPRATGRTVLTVTTAKLTRANANVLAAYLAELEGPQNIAGLPLTEWGLDCWDGAPRDVIVSSDVLAQSDRITLELAVGTAVPMGSLVRLSTLTGEQVVRVAEDIASYTGEKVIVTPRVRTKFPAGSGFHMGLVSEAPFRLKDDMQAGVQFDHNTGSHVVEFYEDVVS